MQVRFGEFEFDKAGRKLRSRGRVVRLQEQSFQVLELLSDRAGQVVTREELHGRLWPAKVYLDVDHSLNNVITRLRDVLRDSAERPRYIETIPRVGYRFIATIAPEPVAPDTPATPAPTPQPAWMVRIVLVVGLAAVGVTAIAYGIWHRSRAVPTIHSVAVLPFENLSSDPGQDYFVDGMTDALITDLAKIDPVSVISRTTSMHYKGVHEPVARLASELKVDAVVEGSIVRAGGRVRLNVRLIRAADDSNLWAQSYDRDIGSVIALQSELAGTIAEALAVTLSPGQRERIAHNHVPPPLAYDSYLRGMHLMRQANKEAEFASIPLFESAIAVDGQFAAAYAGLSQAYSLLGAGGIASGLGSAETTSKALAAARKAVALDPQLADGWTALGQTIEPTDPMLKTAIERALVLSPGDAWVRKRHGDLLWDENDLEGALADYAQSLRLDPLNPRTRAVYGESLVYTGRIEEGFAQLRKATELDPFSFVPRVKLGLAYIYRQRYAEAITEFSKADQISPGSLPVEVGLADAHALAGHTAEAEALLATIIAHAQVLGSPSAVALIQVRLHHRDAALDWLQRALDAGDDTFFRWPDDADWLRSDPAFQALLHKFEEATAAQPAHEAVRSGA
jgi:TolB-like protein/DNA-binding winged helix-turn-helix (wHTH) protein